MTTWPALAREQHLRLVTEVLAASGVRFLVHAPRSQARTAVAVDAGERARVLEALAAAGARFAPSSEAGPRPPAQALAGVERVLRDTQVVAVLGPSTVAPGHPTEDLQYCVEVEFWSQDANGVARAPVRGRYQAALPSLEPDRTVDFVHLGRFHLGSEHALTSLPTHSELIGPSTLDVQAAVDAVFTWVDGTDPRWLARRAAVRGDDWHAEAASLARYVQRDELRYSLRSLRMYAPWIRRIFVVTDDQSPQWLGDSDQVTVVDHRQLFADESALPVFNSHAIESQLHRVPGLSENFLYLNDDMLLGAPTSPADFVTPSGQSVVFLSRNTVLGPSLAEYFTPIDAAFANVRDLIHTDFGVRPRSTAWHAPYSLRVDVLHEMSQRYSDAWSRTMRSRFRSVDDISPTSALYQHYALMTGRGVSGSISYNYTNLAVPDLDLRLERLAAVRNHQALCLNDSDALDDELDRIAGLLGGFLDGYFPLAAPWELGP